MPVTHSEARAQSTQSAARLFMTLAGRLRDRGHDTRDVARLLDRTIVCLFADAAGLVPAGAVRYALERGEDDLRALFQAVGRGLEGSELFADDRVVSPGVEDLQLLGAAAALDWSEVEPSILGQLFERGLDCARRSRLGAHYTDTAAISRIVEPVVLAPLRREFAAMQAGARTRTDLSAFLERLRAVRVLDPSCGAGNFLYVALWALAELELEVLAWGAQAFDEVMGPPRIGSEVVLGIEVNAYAAELARLALWVAEIQWRRAHGLHGDAPGLPRTISCCDAILERADEAQSRRPAWPDAEFIVGNPPFLGGKKLRAELGDIYVDRLFHAWRGQVPREADLVAYWHEAAREQIAAGRCKRAALLATQGIRGGANLEVLRRVKSTGDIFMAWSDLPWVVEGAAVRVSLVAQDDGSERLRELDGAAVAVIHADLTGGGADTSDLTRARRLAENLGVAFMGDTKGGKFDLRREQAAALLRAPCEPGRPSRDVVVPWVNGLDVTRRPRGMHIVDFVDMPLTCAARYPGPLTYVRAAVQPARATNRREAYRERWWIHVEPRPGMRAAIRPLTRFIATPTVARHRIFVWLTPPTLPDHQLIVVARDDDYCLGVLHSRIHELWSLRMCTWLGAGNDPRYTPTTTFETFPFPWPLDTSEDALTSAQRRQRDAIAAIAAALHDARQRWLDPPEWVTQGEPLAPGLAPQVVPRDEVAARELRRRTLTALYNVRPAWLAELHAALDRAVAAAYGWSDDLEDDALLAGLLACNRARAGRPRSGQSFVIGVPGSGDRSTIVAPQPPPPWPPSR